MFLVSLCSLVLSVPQSPWVVDRDGRPGANFTDLPAAVAAAAPGDTILVRAPASIFSNYAAFTVSGKALTIRGEDRTRTICGGATINAVPSGSVFALEGMWMGSVAIDNSNVAIASCGLNLSITNASQVALAGCSCEADFSGNSPARLSNGSTLVATGSRFDAADGRNYINSSCVSHGSSAAVTAVDSHVILHDCWALGGLALYYPPAGPFSCFPATFIPTAGIDLVRSTLRVAGAGTSIAGSPLISADAASQGTVHGNVGPLGSLSPQIVRI